MLTKISKAFIELSSSSGSKDLKKGKNIGLNLKHKLYFEKLGRDVIEINELTLYFSIYMIVIQSIVL